VKTGFNPAGNSENLKIGKLINGERFLLRNGIGSAFPAGNAPVRRESGDEQAQFLHFRGFPGALPAFSEPVQRCSAPENG
jgi:hypothetical protein